MARIKRKFVGMTDASDGWVKVPIKLLFALGIEREISQLSRQRGDWAYLHDEEDFKTFRDAYERKWSTSPNVKWEHRLSGSSRISYYQWFDHRDHAHYNTNTQEANNG